MDNVRFCKGLLLFEIESKSDIGFKKHSCAFGSVKEEYNGPQNFVYFDYLDYLDSLLYLENLVYLNSLT